MPIQHAAILNSTSTRSNTPDGAIIIHSGDKDPAHPGTCKAFVHLPYGLKREYRGEYGLDYLARTKLSNVSASSEECSFCSILYREIRLHHGL